MSLLNTYTGLIATMRSHRPFSPECNAVALKILLQYDPGEITPLFENKEYHHKLITFLEQWSDTLLHSLPDTLIRGSISQATQQAHIIRAIEAIIAHYSKTTE
jgi:hypothetical protein